MNKLILPPLLTALTIFFTGCPQPIPQPVPPIVTGPQIIQITPSSGATVPLNGYITCYFDQDLDPKTLGKIAFKTPNLTIPENQISIQGNRATLDLSGFFKASTIYTGLTVNGFRNTLGITMAAQEFSDYSLSTEVLNDHEPTATNVSIVGDTYVNSVLSGTYTFYDSDGDVESGTTYQWYFAQTLVSTLSPIAGANSKNYTLKLSDLGGYICFEITPSTAVPPQSGISKKSPIHGPITQIVEAQAPVAQGVTITGTQTQGQILTCIYTFSDANGDKESGTTFQWFRLGTLEGIYVPIIGATEKTYTLQSADVGQFIRCEVTPRSEAVPTTGLPVQSPGVGPIASSDKTPPTIISINPPKNKLGVPLAGTIEITFSENLNLATYGNLTLGGTTYTQGVNAQFVISHNKVSLTPNQNLKENTLYQSLAVTGFRDLAGNTMEAYNDPTYGFTTFGKVASPSPTKDSQNFDVSLEIGATISTPGAEIRYTNDGSQPLETSPLFPGTMTLKDTTTLIFKGFKNGLAPSDSVTRTYTKNPIRVTKRVVIIGSSTSEGWGATNRYGWAFMFADYAKSMDSGNEVINLAKAGYSSSDLLPSGDPARNITKALSYNPDIIIINLPSNDANVNRSIAEQVANFQTILSAANGRNITFYGSTTQPRNFPEQSKRDNLMAMKTELYRIFGANTLDFWTTLAQSNGTITTTFDSGDGVHLNDTGHQLLYARAKSLNIFGIPGVIKKKIHYYSPKPAANLHYQKDDGLWTKAPGLAMTKESSDWYVLEVTDEARMEFCFNDNNGAWDSNGGLNYFANFKEIWVKNGVVSDLKP